MEVEVVEKASRRAQEAALDLFGGEGSGRRVGADWPAWDGMVNPKVSRLCGVRGRWSLSA
jgi:hypothetical protein